MMGHEDELNRLRVDLDKDQDDIVGLMKPHELDAFSDNQMPAKQTKQDNKGDKDFIGGLMKIRELNEIQGRPRINSPKIDDSSIQLITLQDTPLNKSGGIKIIESQEAVSTEEQVEFDFYKQEENDESFETSKM